MAHVENKKWRDELNKFLLAYRTTPHSSTGASPAFLMFGRELKTKLPELRPDKSIVDESIRDRDWNRKLAGKAYADKHRQAKQSPVIPGDRVILKNTKTSEKLSPKFESNPYTVQTKEGQELTIKSEDGVVYRRNSSFVKPYQEPEETETVPEPKRFEGEVVSPETPSKPIAVSANRPSRVISLPAKFKDFVMNVDQDHV